MSTRAFEPVKPLRPVWQSALLAALCSLAVAASGVIVLGHDALDSFAWNTWLMLGLAFAMSISGATWAAAQWMSPSGKAGFGRTLAGLIIAILGLAIGSETGPFKMIWAAKCFTIGSMAALLSGLMLVVIFRRSAPIMRQRVAVAAGILAGFVGFLVIQVHCPINEFWHMMLGHALLPLIWGLAGYLLARLSWSR